MQTAGYKCNDYSAPANDLRKYTPAANPSPIRSPLYVPTILPETRVRPALEVREVTGRNQGELWSCKGPSKGEQWEFKPAFQFFRGLLTGSPNLHRTGFGLGLDFGLRRFGQEGNPAPDGFHGDDDREKEHCYG